LSKAVAAIVGPGNIGPEVMIKLEESENIDVRYVVCVDPASDGREWAREAGLIYAGSSPSEKLTTVFERPHISTGSDLNAERAAPRYGKPAHETQLRVGGLGDVGGQDDMVIDVALRLSICPALTLASAQCGTEV
jgi:acetaldehyde dehydrogenase (acetylating)